MLFLCIIIGRSVGVSMASSKQEYFILRNDVPIAKTNNFLRNLLGTENADHVMKGELLVKEALPQYGSHAMYSLALDRNKKVSCSISDVIPLSEDDYEWLAAIRKNMDRWQVYVQGDKLESAKALKVGEKVWVSLPVGDGNLHQLPGTSCSQATVQYIGPLQDIPGRWIGVELKVREKVHYQCKYSQKYIKDKECATVYLSVYCIYSFHHSNFVTCTKMMDNPGIYIQEVQEMYQEISGISLHPTSIIRYANRFGLTRQRMRRISISRSDMDRAEFMMQVDSMDPAFFIWVDETGCDQEHLYAEWLMV